MSTKIALILGNIDNLILNNYWRKFYTYKEIGWDESSIKNYLAKKDFIMQVASFNTPTVSFSASSRRNRFYEIYNRNSMLEMDVPFDEHVLNVLNEIKLHYEIYVITSRKENLHAKTVDRLVSLGFPIQDKNIIFLPEKKNLAQFRQQSISEITQNHPIGIGIAIDPNDVAIYERMSFPVYGFASIKEPVDFGSKKNYTVHNWSQLRSILMNYAEQVKERNKKEQLAKNSQNNSTPSQETSSESAFEKVIFQQLFLGSANILGPLASDYPAIHGFDELINPFLANVKENLKLLRSDQVEQFFQIFAQKMEIDFHITRDELQPTLLALKDQENSKYMQVYLVLTKFLEKLRDHAFLSIGQNQIDQVFRKLAGKPLPESHLQKIHTLVKNNDEAIVILYNLSFLVWLQKTYELSSVQSNISEIYLKHSNHVLSKLFF